MTRSDAGKYKKWRNQVICVMDPPLSSPAALALLTRKMFTMDKSIYSDFRMLRVRDMWMLEQMKSPDEKGGLTCAICGKRGLDPFTSNRNNLATLDHIIGLKDHGAWDEVENFQVACYYCNIKKA